MTIFKQGSMINGGIIFCFLIKITSAIFSAGLLIHSFIRFSKLMNLSVGLFRFHVCFLGSEL